MSDVHIDFMIYEEYPLTHECADDVQGGVRIVVDGLVVTRSEALGREEGFRGDFIYSLLSNWLRAIPKMLSRVPHHSDLLDEPSAFEFIPREEQTYVRYFSSSLDPRNYRFYDDLHDIVSPEDEKWNKTYPNYPTGTPVDTVDLVNAILDVCERFYADIASRTFRCGTGPDAPYVPEFKEALEYGEGVYPDSRARLIVNPDRPFPVRRRFEAALPSKDGTAPLHRSSTPARHSQRAHNCCMDNFHICSTPTLFLKIFNKKSDHMPDFFIPYLTLRQDTPPGDLVPPIYPMHITTPEENDNVGT